MLFVVFDDLNTHVSTSGYQSVFTPTLEQLAAEGMTFKRAYSQYPVCGPSRASFLSGLYPESTGVLDNRTDIRATRPNTVSMPQSFRENGYWTASVGKVFHSKTNQPVNAAWDEVERFVDDELPAATVSRMKWEVMWEFLWDPFSSRKVPRHGPSGLRDDQHKDGKNARQVIRWLEKRSYGEKPFFISLGIHKPHVPFVAPDEYFDLYVRSEIEFDPDSPDLWDEMPSTALNRRYKAFGFDLGKEDEARRRMFMQAYYACVSFVDAQLGLVFEALKAQGVWENTIILLTSDHGYHLGEHFLWGKVTLFDIGTRVPFIVRVPGMTVPGSDSEAMVELVDIFPTLNELAGIPSPLHLQGVSIVPLLRNPTLPGQKKYAYSVVARGDSLGRTIRSQKWRYAKWPDGEELYDLAIDPHERDNLANSPEYELRLEEMRTVLATKQAAVAQ